MKQTAVEWFLTEFQKQVWFEPNSELDIWIKDLIPKAKEMEKEQIIESWNVRAKIDGVLTWTDNRTAEEYYNETYKQQEQ
jgi:hypothetical protein